MNNNKQQRLDKLTAEYNDLNGKINRLDAFLNRLDFETIVPDREEQMLMQHQLNAMRSYRTNLKERIQLLQVQIKRDIDKPCRQVCGDAIATQEHHCGQDECNRSGLMTLKEMVNDYVERCDENERLKIDLHHCGQDASCPVGGGSAAVITGNSLKDLLGMEVISVGDMPCDACNPDNYAGRPCVKVELVGGTYLCLAPQPGSIITE